MLSLRNGYDLSPDVVKTQEAACCDLVFVMRPRRGVQPVAPLSFGEETETVGEAACRCLVVQ
ncbi:hypothetical protein [Geobacillus sp. FSL K6-3411]|uniref:hypothetical protein n=1 Tax=Geobacillus sp. FSL K6-3411 TaxID=2954614 RepID=UPI0030DD4699